MSIKPPLNCPPDYSVLVFRLTECKNASVVKGITTQASTNLNDLVIPIQEHTEGTLTLDGNSTKNINIDDISTKWPLNEVFSCRINLTTYPNGIGNGTSHTYSLYDSSLTLIESFSFTVNSAITNYANFPTALRTAYLATTKIKNLVSFDVSAVLTTGAFTITAVAKATKYRSIFTFDTTGSGNVGPYEHPGTLVTPYLKYPDGRVQYIMVYPQYDKVDTSTCGCADASGDIRSNEKYFQYVERGEYDSEENVKTPILIAAATDLGDVELIWEGASTDHLGYHIKVGDLISTVETPLFRTIVTAIDGYTITIDQPTTADLTISTQQLQHVYSPATPRWKNIGEFLFLSGATDVNDTDFCFIETITLKNPHSFSIPVKYMIGR